jgi:hypothetical protein
MLPIPSSSLSDEIIVAVFMSHKGVQFKVSNMTNNRKVYVYIYIFQQHCDQNNAVFEQHEEQQSNEVHNRPSVRYSPE